MSAKIIDLRGSKVTPIHRGSVCRAGGKPSTWFPPGTRRADHLIIILPQNFLHGELLKCKFPDPGVFDTNFRRNSKISSFFQHFGEEAARLLTKVSSSSEADTHRKLNFNTI